MKLEYYDQYLHFKAVGLRAEAKRNVLQFVNSFTSITEKEQWTRQIIETNGDWGRYEIYEGVVFPVLLQGYQNHDPWSILWLARTAQNFYTAKYLHEQIDYKTEGQLLMELYELDPRNPEVCKYLLRLKVGWLDHCIHEYPTGIIYGMNGASIDECHEILSEVESVRELDTEKVKEEFLNDVQSKVLEYITRLQKTLLIPENLSQQE